MPASWRTIAATGAKLALPAGTCACPWSTATPGSRPAKSSSARRDLPDPASPTIVTSDGVPAATTSWNASRSAFSSRPRPTNGIVRRTDLVDRPCTGCARSGSSNPLAATSRASANDTAMRVSAWVVVPTRTSPGAAAVCRRAAAFTTEPVTSSCSDGPLPVAASPDSMPTLTSSSSGEPELLAQAVRPGSDRESGPHGAQGVVLVHLVQAEDGHDRIADELLRPAPQVQQLVGRGIVEPAEHLAGALGVELLREPGGVDQVGEEHRHDLALVGREGARDGRAAARAEPGVVGQGAATGGAYHRVPA